MVKTIDPARSRIAFRRRLLLLLLILVPSFIASQFMLEVLPHQGSTRLELVILLVFSLLFGWISMGLWIAVLGFFAALRGHDHLAITHDLKPEDEQLDRRARTAVIMPIYGEDMARVCAGLQASYESLRETGQLECFDFIIVSDTTDPDQWVQEEVAWADLCQRTDGFGRIFYRRRWINLKRKSGNVADFCRRWGQHYRYMVVFDADSIMSGRTLVRLVAMMEKHGDVGLIQSLPVVVNQRTLYARVQQFASQCYGPIFAAGLHWWQLGDGQYWGHNAIIRIKPFVEHCALARLPGRPPLGGEILSHDFVESALMRRAGWSVWLAYDLGGSYEESPPSLLDEMKRDRRWCQGNLQHVRLLFADGLFPAHRALFMNGVMSYVSALLWFIFLGLSTAEAILEVLRTPDYFPAGPSLFPQWPVWHPQWALILFIVTAIILFLPKILSIVIVVWRRQTRQFGGFLHLIVSVILEILFSTLLAPIRALFHSKFVLFTLLGQNVNWGSQNRGETETSWREAFRFHGGGTLFATIWGLGVFWLNPGYFWWLTPIVGALFLSIPVSVFASRASWGQWLARWGFFLTPMETAPAQEIVRFRQHLLELEQAHEEMPAFRDGGFISAVVDPDVNALHVALLGLERGRRLQDLVQRHRKDLMLSTVANGPAKLGKREKKILLSDPHLLLEFHRQLWVAPDAMLKNWTVMQKITAG